MSFVLKKKAKKEKTKKYEFNPKNLVCRDEPKFLKSEINYRGLDHYFLINIKGCYVKKYLVPYISC